MRTQTVPIVLRWVSAEGIGKKLWLAFLGSLLVALLARVSVPLPFTPVPVTGQTFGVLFLGALLGSRLGALALFAYLLEGALGLLVFAKGAGLGYLFGPTGGYLLAFPLAAYLVGWALEAGLGRGFLSALLAFLAGSLLIYALGVPWLSVYLGMDLAKALALGALPFLAGDLVKAVLAALAWRALDGGGR